MLTGMHRFLHSRWAGFGLVMVLLLLWQEAAVNRVVDPVFIPPVGDIFHAWLGAMRDGSLRDALLGTLLRFALGYGIAVLLGVTVGVLLGWWSTMYALLEPLVELLRPLPSPAIVPVFILLLGIEDRMKITVVVFAACFAVIVNTMQGIRGVDPTLIDTARTFGYKGLAIVRRVVFPAALPSIFAGMRISLAIALIVTVVAEMLAGNAGMGYFILDAQRSFQIPQMYAAIFTLAVLGYLLNRLFLAGEHLALRWYIDRSQ